MNAAAHNPVIGACSYCLAHVPDLVRFGSKPWREIAKDASFEARLTGALRSFPDAARYPPNQTFIGNLTPEALAALPRPWFDQPHAGRPTLPTIGPFGEIVSQELFYATLKQANVLRPALVELGDEAVDRLHATLREHTSFGMLAGPGWKPVSAQALRAEVEDGTALALRCGPTLAGCVRGDRRAQGRGDRNLDAPTILEALCVKASGSLALSSLLCRHDLDPESVDFIISCGEEAAGDRYQRGGGGMAKAIGEMCGCARASGMDIKNFCAAPASALMTAGALVKSGLYERVIVVAGGSLAKLGMKSQAFLDAGLPILGDCLACMAFLVTRDDANGPILHLEPGTIGIARIGASTADDAVYRQLILDPLQALGLRMSDIDKFAPELHNPEIMEYSGSGDVVRKNYRTIGALAGMAGEIQKADMASFIERIGMVGFAPPQGHIPSGVPYIGHAMKAMRQGELKRVMFVCKASLFLNRLTELYDGVSFVLEANPRSVADTHTEVRN
ncbi:MAG: glycine/sarcosine/betaine reductase complex component C subunit beta [Gammaproteobacteria bacterium]